MPKKCYEIGYKSHPSLAVASSRVVEDSTTILPTIEGLNPSAGTTRER